MLSSPRILISGGGTGGHIFPALAIANALRALCPEAQLLFVGAEGRMEMTRVPAAGYDIVGLPVRGLHRPLYSPRNIGVMVAFLRCRQQVKALLRTFRPQVAVGVGGYASAPTLTAAHALGIPCLIQEQNSYAGVTNRSLASAAQTICVAYDGMERFFPKEKLRLTGNPVRQELLTTTLSRAAAQQQFAFATVQPTVLIIGGSLGARTLNESVAAQLPRIAATAVNIIWQTGSYYYPAMLAAYAAQGSPKNIHVTEFISDMSAAYRAADLVVSRAGASSISELCLIGKAAILVPSPNVAEDHQTHNARALADNGAALLIADSDARATLIDCALTTVGDSATLQQLATNIHHLARPDAATAIAREVLTLITTP